jgi:hypothetical protein
MLVWAADRLWEIAENLHLADLTVLGRAAHIAEWVRLAGRRWVVRRFENPKNETLTRQGKPRRVDHLGGRYRPGYHVADILQQSSEFRVAGEDRL